MQLRIFLMQSLHHATGRLFLVRGHQQMAMVGHKNESVHRTSFGLAGGQQNREIGAVIFRGSEHDVAIVTSLDNMQGNAGFEMPEWSRHRYLRFSQTVRCKS
jgi:hypothetical protein